MILNNECYLKETCKKYLQNNCNEEFCIKLFKIEQLYNLGLLTNNQKKRIALRIDSDGTDREEFNRLKEIEKNIESFVNKGNNLYLYSENYGNGKSSWATRLLQAYINKIWYKTEIECKILFINVPKYLISLKDNISQKNEYITHIKNNIINCDLVVWDDIGTKIGTEFEIEQMLNTIDNRLINNKSNIYTSNIEPIKIKEKLGERLYSRIINLSQIIELKGKDKRGITTIQ